MSDGARPRVADASVVRLPFLILLLLAGAAAFAADVWLGVGLVLLFGRAFLAGAHRRPAFGSAACGIGSSPGATGTVVRDGPDGEPSLVELLPLP